MKIDVIKNKWVFLGISAILVLASSFSIFSFGFNQGIDFTGGSLWQIKMPGVSSDEVKAFFNDELSLPVFGLSHDSSSEIYSLTFAEITDADRQNYFSLITDEFGAEVEEQDFWTISPSVSNEIRTRAIYAIVLVLVGISLYIAFAFRKVSRPISSWKYGLVTLATLMHDVIIPAGMFAILGHYMGLAIDTNFVVALLVVMGFSVHDTIIVFDRVRENLTKSKNSHFGTIINHSVNETIRRSINTSLTLILVLVALYFLGPVSLKYFILVMLVGTTAGTYSSIFVASPLLSLLSRKK